MFKMLQGSLADFRIDSVHNDDRHLVGGMRDFVNDPRITIFHRKHIHRSLDLGHQSIRQSNENPSQINEPWIRP
jgi:hypothetical protein